jgi:dihydropteroate synthase
MGILNLTPDSFFDGGKYREMLYAIDHVEEMIQEGAHIIDLGGESSRPGADPVPLEEERQRVIPILNKIRSAFPDAAISVDTYKPEMAAEVLENGADIINDIYGLRQEGMAEVIAEHQAYTVIMHMQGEPGNMQKNPRYRDAVQEVEDFFAERMDFALKKGISMDRIILDPGIGFGKSLENNIQLIKASRRFKEKFKLPVLIGASRKSMIGKILGNETGDRLNGSVIVHTMALNYGADIIRAHDIRETRESIQIFSRFQA